MPALVAQVDAILATRNRDEWGALFDKSEIIWGPVLSLDEVTRDAQAEAIGMFPSIHHPQLGDYKTVGNPMRFGGCDVRPRGPAPETGAQTRAILSEAGLTQEEIATLEARGIAGAGPKRAG